MKTLHNQSWKYWQHMNSDICLHQSWKNNDSMWTVNTLHNQSWNYWHHMNSEHFTQPIVKYSDSISTVTNLPNQNVISENQSWNLVIAYEQ